MNSKISKHPGRRGWWIVLLLASILLAPGVAAQSAEPVLASVDDLLTVEFSGLRYNRRTSTYDTLARVTNTSQRPVYGPLQLAIRNISPTTVTLANAAATAGEVVNVPVAGESLRPGAKIDNILVQFRNPSGVRFTFGHGVLGQRLLVRAPRAAPAALAPATNTAVEFMLNVYGGRAAGLQEVLLQVTHPGSGLVSGVALRDDGQVADRYAGDGIYAGLTEIDTAGLAPDQCFGLQAFATAEGVVTVSGGSRLCVSGFPVGTVGGDAVIDHPGTPAAQVLADQMLVRFRAGVTETAIQGVAASVGAQVVGTIPELRIHQLHFGSALPPDAFAQALQALRANPEVEVAEPNGLLELAGQPREDIDDIQPSLVRIGAPEAWKAVKAQERPGGPPLMAVLDSGVSFAHADLLDTDLLVANPVTRTPRLKCLGTSTTGGLHPEQCVTDTANPPDVVGHGTHVAGIAAALPGNGSGTAAGVSWGAKLISLRLVEGNGIVAGADLYNGIARARNEAARVMNASLGKQVNYSCALLDPVLSDVLVVAAAGNDASDTLPYFPALCPGVLAVANSRTVTVAGTSTDKLYQSSNFGSWVDLAAPGTGVVSTVPADDPGVPTDCPLLAGHDGIYCDPTGYMAHTGTSMAAPAVAGAASLLLSRDDTLTPADLIQRFRDTGVSITRRETAKPTAPVPVPPDAALATAIPRLDLCAAVLFTGPSPLRFDAGGGTISENPAADTLVGTLIPSCDRVHYTLTAGGPAFVLSRAGAGADRRIEIRAPAGAAIDYELPATHSRPITVQAKLYPTVQDVAKAEANDPTTPAPLRTASANLTVAVIDVNEPPSVAVNPVSAQRPEGVTPRVKVADVTVTDDALGSETVTLSGPDAALFELVGTQLFLRAGTLDFVTNPALEVTVAVDDPAVGGTPDATAGFRLEVVNVNVAPSGADRIVTVSEDSFHVFTAAEFGFSDPGDSPPNTLQAVRIATLPAQGSLTLNAVAVTAGQSVSAAALASGQLRFAPAPGATGTPYATFTFQVQDNGGTSSGGVDLDPSANTLTVNVLAQPSFAIADAVASEGGTLTFTVTRSGSTATSQSVSYTTGNGTATAAADFQATSGTLTFLVGETSRPIPVPTVQNTTFENVEAFTVTLSNPTGGAVITRATATGTIVDDDPLVVVPAIARSGINQTVLLAPGNVETTQLLGNGLIAGGQRLSTSQIQEFASFMEFAPVTVPAGTVISSARVRIGAPQGDAVGGTTATQANVFLHGYAANGVAEEGDLQTANLLAGPFVNSYDGTTFTALPAIDADVTAFVRGQVSGGSVRPGFTLRTSPVPPLGAPLLIGYPAIGSPPDLTVAPRLEVTFAPAP